MARTAGRMIVVVQATLLVLAGGASRRMGRSKAWLPVDDTNLVRLVVASLAPAFSEVMVAFAEPEQIEELIPYRVVFDRKVSAGPLAGLEAGLSAARNEITFAIACDMPFVTQAVAQIAVAAVQGSDAAIPRIGGRPEPVCAAYRRSALPVITAALDGGRYRAADVVEQVEGTWLEGLDPQLFRSLNTPEDYERFRGALPSQR